ncbi:MAG TPA: sensor domain-containing diguanylate cyclase [Candidatus Methylomirabilis sp.]|nr:sensor domain-containing diguanylate cyclase [Candidatus Methylomirabilis sp.]
MAAAGRRILTIDPEGLLPAAVQARLTAEGFQAVPVGRSPQALHRLQVEGAAAILACDRAADPLVRRLVASALGLEPHLPVVLLCPGGVVDPQFSPDPRHQPLGLPLPPDPDALVSALRRALEEEPEPRRPPRPPEAAGPLIPLEAFHEVGKALTSTLKLSEILNSIADTMSHFVQCEAWSLLLMDERRQELRFEVATGEQGPVVKQFRLKPGEGIAGWVAGEGEACIVEDVAADARFAAHVDGATGFTTRTVLCVPLKSKGKVLGVIELLNKVGGAVFDSRDLQVVRILADYAAIAIENARLYQRAEELAVTDDVTGIHNSRYFHHILERELNRARRYQRPLSVLFIDLDYFKAVNDTHGHQQGSQVLREVAQVLKTSIRTVDLIARYGGDEFIVVLPDTDAATAARLGERLRTTLAKTEFLAPEGLALRLTASFGVAAYPDHARTKEELIRFADQAMYRAKGHRRNTVYIATELAEPAPERPARRRK